MNIEEWMSIPLLEAAIVKLDLIIQDQQVAYLLGTRPDPPKAFNLNRKKELLELLDTLKKKDVKKAPSK